MLLLEFFIKNDTFIWAFFEKIHHVLRFTNLMFYFILRLGRPCYQWSEFCRYCKKFHCKYASHIVLNLSNAGFSKYCPQIDQPSELHSLSMSSLEIAETQKCDGCRMNFQHCQIFDLQICKKFLKAY